MRTTINIDDDIINEIFAHYQSKTKTEAINRALNDLIKLLKKNKLIALRGKIDIDDNIDSLKHKELEEIANGTFDND
jgi:hypothetical protein